MCLQSDPECPLKREIKLQAIETFTSFEIYDSEICDLRTEFVSGNPV